VEIMDDEFTMSRCIRVSLTPEQREELHHRSRERVVAPRVRDRLEMIRLSDLGWSVPRIARTLNLHEQTVRKYIKAFMAHGFDALPDRPRPGRPKTITEEHLAAVERLLEAGANGGMWTLNRLAEWLQQQHGVIVTPGRLGALLRRRRAHWRAPDDHEYATTTDRIPSPAGVAS
jgi:putative transposase